MNKKIFFSILSLVALNSHLFSYENFEGKPIGSIRIQVENPSLTEREAKFKILQEMQSHEGETFDQEVFDNDLKKLSNQYDWVEPSIQLEEGKVHITIMVKPKPVVNRIEVVGNRYFTSKKILREAGIKVGEPLQRDELYDSINKLREFYIKRGYLKIQVSAQIENDPATNRANIILRIREGKQAFIQKIVFKGFTSKEKKEALKLLHSSTYNPVMYWLVGSGVARDQIVESDQQVLINYMQNLGYADAHIDIQLEEMPTDVPRARKGVAMVITLERGPLYHIDKISFSGETLKKEEDIQKAIPLKQGDVFSIDKIRASQEAIQDLYSREGYLDTVVNYKLDLAPEENAYNVQFTIEESEKYRVGLITVSGNYSTNKNVIYNNIDLTPGETFNSNKLKSTQQRLQSTGLFKNVNVYTVKGEDVNATNGPQYRDVVIEVSENRTAHVSAFAGFNSTENVFGGVDFAENNFNVGGFKHLFTDGISSLRGGGQFLQVRGQIGKRDSGVNISWLDPYFIDTLWRFSTDLNYNYNNTIKDYKVHTFGTALSLSYPITPYLSYGYKFRVRDSILSVAAGSPSPAIDQEKNNGWVSGFGVLLNYDSTDSPFKAHRGMRSLFETEFAGVIRNNIQLDDFPFLKFSYAYHFYYPVTMKSTFKIRSEFKFIQPIWVARPPEFPVSEKFYLGGESTMRGYKPGQVGPFYQPGEPTGGLSSGLLSFELQHNLFRPLDIFAFYDMGSVNLKPWSLPKIYQSVGVGIRVNTGQRLPFVVGYGYPINPDTPDQVQNVFFSMAGEF